MEFFNFVETFFFISLAITFILIMMLVYHFKERLSVLEQKTNTMFDIINNIVQEIQGIKTSPVQLMPVSNNIPFSNFPIQNIFSQMNDKIVVSEDENENENDDDEYDDSDEESDDENIKRINIDLSTSNDETVDDIQVEELNDSDEIDEMEELDEIDMYDHSETKEPEKKEEPVYEIIDSDSYRKMDINALRTLVITKGLAKDTRKLKKMDLIRLLDPSA